MAKIHAITTNFSTGEATPKIFGRVDLQRYNSALKELRNAIPLKQGGAIRAPGTVYITAAVDAANTGAILPFVFDKVTNYMVEFGNLILRFYYGSGPTRGRVLVGATHYSIVSPYAAAQIADIRYAQKANTMLLAHGDVHPQRLQRFTNTLWAIGPERFVAYPSAEFNTNQVSTLTLSATTGAITATAGAGVFLASDVGRQIEAGTGLMTITGFTSTFIVTGVSVRDFNILVYPTETWALTDSPQTILTPSVAGPLNAAVTLTLTVAGWRGGDVGKYVKFNGGIVEITGFTSNLIVTGVVRRVLTSTTAAQAGAWTLEEKSWSTARGFPQSVTLYEGRAIYGGTRSQPNTIWGSAIGDVADFAIGIDADEAFEFTLDSGTADLIQHLDSLRTLVGLTASAEFSVSGGDSGSITPTSVRARAHTFYGASKSRPIKIGYELFFSLFAGRQLRNYSYDFTTDSYVSGDLSELADHLLESGLSRLAYAKEPFQILWACMADGSLASLTYDSGTDVQMRGWAAHPDGAAYLDVCSLPGSAGDQVWFRVRRTINGVSAWFIEAQDANTSTHACVLTSATGSPPRTVSGLSHLNGATVDVLISATADVFNNGVAQPQLVVSGGVVTTVRDAPFVEVGLPYVSRIVPLKAEFQQDGTSQGRAASVNEVTLRVIESKGLKVNGVPLRGRQFGEDVLDQPPIVRNEDLQLSTIGWSPTQDDDLIVITQDQPYFFHILSLVREITIS